MSIHQGILGTWAIMRLHRISNRQKLFLLLVIITGYHLAASKIAFQSMQGDFNLQKKWVYKADNRIATVAISEDGMIFIRTPDSLTSIDAENGSEIWKTPFTSTSVNPNSGRVYESEIFVSNNKTLLALDKNSGVVLWTSTVKNRAGLDTAIQDVSICCVLLKTLKGAYTAFDRRTGRQLWEIATGNVASNSVIALNNQFLVADSGFKVLIQQTGREVWEEDQAWNGSSVYFQGSVG